MQKYTKESKELRDKIIAFAKSIGFKVDSSEKQARAYRIWMTGPKDANEKMRDFLAQNKVAHADEEGYDDTGHDEFVSDIETSFQNDPFEGNMLVITHWYATPTKLDRGIDATVSDKDYFGEIRREIRKVLCEQKENEFTKDTIGWYMDGEGGWADIPLLKKHLDSSFVGIHNDGTYFFDTEDPSERSGDMLSFRGFSEVLHRLGLKVDAHKVSDQLYKLSPQRLKIDLIEADLERGAQRDQDRRLERPELRYKHPNKFSKGATFPYADVKMMKSPINRDKLVIRFDGRSYEIMNRDTGEFFAEELSHIELEDTLVQLDVDREMTRSLVVQSESGQEVNIP